MRIALTALAAGLLCTGSAQAQEFNTLLPGCRAAAEDRSDGPLYVRGHCIGLIEGIAWADPKICPPSGFTLGQAANVVMNYANKIPQRWHEPRERIVTEALRHAWPCSR